MNAFQIRKPHENHDLARVLIEFEIPTTPPGHQTNCGSGTRVVLLFSTFAIEVDTNGMQMLKANH
ncbi:hypothetical protein C7450_103242 [Chelatococcus asaccharovorans]|uniref:Uncharacterized protein n=1 Tax=Chelatococcus asaccharovorans TaxID=28210 RepID=A0A2V3UB29_9HYPH|nr:hypothetical protein C7450_103242 [Chelatococcus asaccharovorans]